MGYIYLKPKELVTNGEFTSNITSWTTIAGAGSAAYNSGGNGRLRLNDYAAYQAITTSKNTEYRIQVKVYDSNSVGQALKSTSRYCGRRYTKFKYNINCRRFW